MDFVYQVELAADNEMLIVALESTEDEDSPHINTNQGNRMRYSIPIASSEGPFRFTNKKKKSFFVCERKIKKKNKIDLEGNSHLCFN